MAKYFKTGKTKEELAVQAAQVSETVKNILEDIEISGDAAVRSYSERFDKWSPGSFRLTDEQIEGIIQSVPKETINDIKFAQEQIRRFAEAQKAALRDLEVETIPGVILGHKNIPL